MGGCGKNQLAVYRLSVISVLTGSGVEWWNRLVGLCSGQEIWEQAKN
ncbi:hypothetical protein MTBBW1_300086 [Desulfamplus magnetovallimortis]|uniref:Uncharacterized protein n=1 Tax=Desulfamplus magnetovallimortis TaxID=1246637 RepID=A0A1W1HG33_9BACT|nr:hypothetical protein MTBBW1_300086 [Desulfamplus magnetovallimortis]